MLNEIHRYIWNFMPYKMIYFLSHKFAFSNLRFSPFYEHFRQLREKYAFKLKMKVHHDNQLTEPNLMMYIYITFIQLYHTHPSTYPPTHPHTHTHTHPSTYPPTHPHTHTHTHTLNFSKYSSRC